MTNNKLKKRKVIEIVMLALVLIFIIINAVLHKDSPIALVSALCGITYTFIAGLGKPICYLFGVTGSSFYSILSLQNALWGNLILYMAYYIPMQIIGFFQWNKNLKDNKKEIIKIKLTTRELIQLLSILAILTLIAYVILDYFNDKQPLLDSITTVLSIGGMYLTVRRAIEQWIFWMVVNLLSLIMWIGVVINGTKAYSTVIMWAVYLFLAFYFYISWKKDMKE